MGLGKRHRHLACELSRPNKPLRCALSRHMPPGLSLDKLMARPRHGPHLITFKAVPHPPTAK